MFIYDEKLFYSLQIDAGEPFFWAKIDTDNQLTGDFLKDVQDQKFRRELRAETLISNPRLRKLGYSYAESAEILVKQVQKRLSSHPKGHRDYRDPNDFQRFFDPIHLFKLYIELLEYSNFEKGKAHDETCKNALEFMKTIMSRSDAIFKKQGLVRRKNLIMNSKK